jgi:3-methyladenine DNA glycosylase AlkD
MPKRPSAAAVRRLQRALDARASERTREWWERYLKGSAAFRGVPMAGVREVMCEWWLREGINTLPRAEQRAMALRLFEEQATEDKLAGVLALADVLLPSLTRKDLPAFARLFAGGLIADWNLCDWFCVKVLGRMVEQAEDRAPLARAITAWSRAKPLWQRRASLVAFANLAQRGDGIFPGMTELLLETSAVVVRDPARFAQTGVGWILRELSHADRRAVVEFVEENAAQMSREGARYATAKMPEQEKKRLLALHQRRVPAEAKRTVGRQHSGLPAAAQRKTDNGRRMADSGRRKTEDGERKTEDRGRRAARA